MTLTVPDIFERERLRGVPAAVGVGARGEAEEHGVAADVEPARAAGDVEEGFAEIDEVDGVEFGDGEEFVHGFDVEACVPFGVQGWFE